MCLQRHRQKRRAGELHGALEQYDAAGLEVVSEEPGPPTQPT